MSKVFRLLTQATRARLRRALSYLEKPYPSSSRLVSWCPQDICGDFLVPSFECKSQNLSKGRTRCLASDL